MFLEWGDAQAAHGVDEALTLDPTLHIRLEQAPDDFRHLRRRERRANDLADGRGVALRAANRLDASAVMINDLTAFRTDWMPFAGRRQSGYGVGGIPSTMREMSQEKMLVLRQFPH